MIIRMVCFIESEVAIHFLLLTLKTVPKMPEFGKTGTDNKLTNYHISLCEGMETKILLRLNLFVMIWRRINKLNKSFMIKM